MNHTRLFQATCCLGLSLLFLLVNEGTGAAFSALVACALVALARAEGPRRG